MIVFQLTTFSVVETARELCRKCFYAYDKYIKLQDTILENIRKASDVLELDLDVQPGSRHSAITGLSPEVAVGSLFFYCVFVY